MQSNRQRDSVRHVHKQSSEHKPTRVRTVLNEKQLHTLRTCYNANPRPDALMKEQLVEMTNLSPRVIRVWFQNKRCKDKKRSILMKQMQQQEKVSDNCQHCRRQTSETEIVSSDRQAVSQTKPSGGPQTPTHAAEVQPQSCDTTRIVQWSR